MSNKPQPPPGWVSRIAGFLKRPLFGINATQPTPEVRPEDTFTSRPEVDSGDYINQASSWRVARERYATYKDIENMDADDEMIAQGLDIFADCATGVNENSDQTEFAPLKVASDDEEAKRILDALVVRLRLNGHELWQLARDTIKYAEHYREVILSPDRTRIIDLAQVRTVDIWPKTSKTGHKKHGWFFRTQTDVIAGHPGKELEEWQVAPFLFGNRIGTQYIPLLAAARRNWQRLQKIEDGMAIARLTRSWVKLVHRVPVKSNDTAIQIRDKLLAYKNSISKKKLMGSDSMLTQGASPFDVDTDFFLPEDEKGRGGLSAVDESSSALTNLDDVYYLRERLIARLSVPMGYLQIMSTQKTHLRAGSAMSPVDVAFAQRLRALQESLVVGLRRVFDLELLLNGITPSTELYKIELPRVVTTDLMQDAKIALTYAQAAAYYSEAFGALPLALMQRKFLSLTSEQQKLLDTFLATHGKRIEAAKVKSLETDAAGSGSQNKSKAARSLEQGAGEFADLFFMMQAELAEEHNIDPGTLPSRDDILHRLVTV